MGKVKYVKCPRCDLNYMDSRQEYCDFCKAELGMKSNLVIEDEDEDVGLDEELTKLCPICKRVYRHRRGYVRCMRRRKRRRRH